MSCPYSVELPLCCRCVRCLQIASFAGQASVAVGALCLQQLASSSGTWPNNRYGAPAALSVFVMTKALCSARQCLVLQLHGDHPATADGTTRSMDLGCALNMLLSSLSALGTLCCRATFCCMPRSSPFHCEIAAALTIATCLCVASLLVSWCCACCSCMVRAVLFGLNTMC